MLHSVNIILFLKLVILPGCDKFLSNFCNVCKPYDLTGDGNSIMKDLVVITSE